MVPAPTPNLEYFLQTTPSPSLILLTPNRDRLFRVYLVHLEGEYFLPVRPALVHLTCRIPPFPTLDFLFPLSFAWACSPGSFIFFFFFFLSPRGPIPLFPCQPTRFPLYSLNLSWASHVTNVTRPLLLLLCLSSSSKKLGTIVALSLLA